MSEIFNSASEFQRKYCIAAVLFLQRISVGRWLGEEGLQQRQPVFSSTQQIPQLQDIMRKASSASLVDRVGWGEKARYIGTNEIGFDYLHLFV